jgi:hypothetical protein
MLATTQLEQSEKFDRNCAVSIAESALGSSLSYRAGKSEYAPSNVMTSVKCVKPRYRSVTSRIVAFSPTHWPRHFEHCRRIEYANLEHNFVYDLAILSLLEP